jgi:hypothetical protein
MAGVAAGGSMSSEWVLAAPAAVVVNKQAVVAATVGANAGVQHCNRARARVFSQFAPPRRLRSTRWFMSDYGAR